MEQGGTFLTQADQALDTLTQNVRRLRSVVLQRGSDGRGFQVAQTLSTEVDRLIESSVNNLNSEINGTYLFAGFRSKTKPSQVCCTKLALRELEIGAEHDGGFPLR